MSEPTRYEAMGLEVIATPTGEFVLWEDYAALQAENERLRKAGDDLEFLVCFNYEGDIKGDKHCMGILDAWLAAKERKR